MEFCAANNADFASVYELAANNDLLIEGLSAAEFNGLLQWLYKEVPHGPGYQLLGYEAGRLVAHYGAMPIPFICRGKKLLAGLASNLVIEKSLRKDSPFFSLQREFLKGYRHAGLDLLSGLITRDGLLEPHLRAGWKKVADIPVLARPIAMDGFVKKLFKNKILSAITWPFCMIGSAGLQLFKPGPNELAVSEVPEFDSSFTPLLEQFNSKSDFGVLRSVPFLNWRFKAIPGRNYRIMAARNNGHVCGYTVLRGMDMKGFNTLAVVDLVYEPGSSHVFRALLRAIIAEAHRNHVELVATIANPNNELTKWLKRWGFFATSKKFSLVAHIPKESQGVFPSETLSRWPVTWLEHDYI